LARIPEAQRHQHPIVDVFSRHGFQNSGNGERMKANVLATRTDPKGLRIHVRLDPGMLVEAMILERLNALPKRRHQDWIRYLLVQGFLAESRVFRQLDGTASENRVAARPVQQSPRSGFDFAKWTDRSSNSRAVPSVNRDVPRDDRPSSPKQPGASKPFAQLRKVVG
jgi:hypothetical protein